MRYTKLAETAQLLFNRVRPQCTSWQNTVGFIWNTAKQIWKYSVQKEEKKKVVELMT